MGAGSETDAPFNTSPTVSFTGPGGASTGGAGGDDASGTQASLTVSATPFASTSLLFISATTSISLALCTSASEMGSETGAVAIPMDGTTSSLGPSPAALASPDAGGGGGTARLAGARFGSGGAPGAGDTDLEEGANGDDTGIFPRRCNAVGGCPGDGDFARTIAAGAGDPVRDRLMAGLAGRELGGGDIGEERRERGRETGDPARATSVGVVGVMGSGTVCGKGGGRWSWVGSAVGSAAATGWEVVCGNGEASDGGVAKVISSTGVEGVSDALSSTFSGPMWPFTLAAGSLVSEVVISCCVLQGETAAVVVDVLQTKLRIGSSGGSCISTWEVVSA